jgi:hypothetical protein
MLARIVVSVLALVCLLGWICTLSSYARYREIAAYSPPAARNWPFWGTALSGPYAVCAASAFAARRNREIAVVALGAGLLLSALGIWECCAPVSRETIDPEIAAGMRLFLVAGVQYLVSGPPALVAIVAACKSSPGQTSSENKG